MHSIDHVLKDHSRYTRELSGAVDMGITDIMLALGRREDRFGGVITEERKSVLRGALSLYGSGQIPAARKLIALLKCKGVFETALTEVVNDHFEISDWTIE